LTPPRKSPHPIRRSLEEGWPVGRALEFITQEIFRELNTLGAKSTTLRSRNTSSPCKAELEKIREQIQNLE
jgi:uncharacterized protein (TIGR00255 family)